MFIFWNLKNNGRTKEKRVNNTLLRVGVLKSKYLYLVISKTAVLFFFYLCLYCFCLLFCYWCLFIILKLFSLFFLFASINHFKFQFFIIIKNIKKIQLDYLVVLSCVDDDEFFFYLDHSYFCLLFGLFLDNWILEKGNLILINFQQQ